MSGKRKPSAAPEQMLGVVYWEAGGEPGPRFRLIEGFKDADEARRFTNWSGRSAINGGPNDAMQQVPGVRGVDRGGTPEYG